MLVASEPGRERAVFHSAVPCTHGNQCTLARCAGSQCPSIAKIADSGFGQGRPTGGGPGTCPLKGLCDASEPSRSIRLPLVPRSVPVERASLEVGAVSEVGLRPFGGPPSRPA